ncbi:MAG: DUF72 domain-containing protein [Thermodesulfovibrionales bacterium]
MIRVGMCSWTEKTLIKSGGFYPRGVSSAEDRLRFYARHYDTVEVDSTYYAIPDASTAALWAGRTPEGFVFHVKAYGALTGHGVDPRTLPADMAERLAAEQGEGKHLYVRDEGMLRELAARFSMALSLLREAGRLGLVVFQFPPWLRRGPEGEGRVLRAAGLMEGFSLAVEFRHGSWLLPEARERVFALLRANRLTYVTADEPQYGTLATVPFVPRVTTDTAYFRLHGRNAENWLKRGIETSRRFAYLYSDEELSGIARAAREADGQAQAAYVMFNNCYGDFAARNSRRMKEVLSRKSEGG